MKTLCTLLLLSLCFPLVAQQEQLRQKHFNTKSQIVLEGYDPVSYHDKSGPKKGLKNLSYTYRGVTYLFATTSNLQRFKENPAAFEPAYGGWCAFAMGESGEKVKIDPETFKILDGRLYLFYNFWGNNTLNDWLKNEKTLKDAADRNWKKIAMLNP